MLELLYDSESIREINVDENRKIAFMLNLIGGELIFTW